MTDERSTQAVPAHKTGGEPPETSETTLRRHRHWLTRARTVRWLWIVFIIILAVTVLMQVMIDVQGYLGVDGWFGFNAVYGLGTFAIMVIFARLLGFLLKRRDDYYDV